MPNARLLALALMLLAANSEAQGRRSFGKTEAPDYGSVRASGVKLSSGDMQDMNPAKVILDKRKDLKLTDDQQNRVRALVDRVKESQKASYKTLDSLRTETRPRIDGDAEIENVRINVAREQMRSVVQSIRAEYVTVRAEALAMLDAAQLPKAEELLKQQSEEDEEVLQDKLGGGRGGAGAGGRRGRPPA